MSNGATFECSVITPERVALECQADSVVFPAHDGELGILNHRAPLICRLGIGILRIHRPEGEETLFIDGGFAQMVGNKLTILTEQARKADAINGEQARAELEEARSLAVTDDESFENKTRAVKRAETKLKMVGQ